MKSVCLVPYCPWPADTGTKVEMMKYLRVLRALGPCTIASARSKPVGFGWTPEAGEALKQQGFELVFREDSERFRPVWLFGYAYAAFCTALRLDRSFGHANPYHRYAFSERWWRWATRDADLAVMQYGFWSRLRSGRPQVVVVHELLSNYHHGGSRLESRELAGADLLCVVGYDEKAALEARGCTHVLWSPPAIQKASLPLPPDIGLVGTRAPQNLEGLRWLEGASIGRPASVKVFGNLAGEVRAGMFEPVGRYGANIEPYQRCGVHLMTRSDRPGLQIKVVEALACGRVIVARKGSMRGLPPGEAAWVEVETPDAMLREAYELQGDRTRRESLAFRARAFYNEHLDSERIIESLKQACRSTAARSVRG